VAYALQAKTFAPDYRLAPEDPFPAQLEDACAAYDWLCEQGSPSRIVLAGDSSGGNLVLSLLLRLRDSGRPLPRLAVCLSPGTDLTQYQQIADTDETCDWIDCRLFNQWSAWYTNGNAVDEPLVSPVHASLRGLPPVYIQAGGAELLYPRIQAFAARAHEQGANVVLEIWRHMPHVFQSFAGLQGEADDALARLGCIADVHMAPGGSARAVARTR
jgi:epsilon-lactone hydrolase